MLVSCLTFAVSPEGHAQGLSRPALRIVVIAGEDAINVIQQKTAVTPIVEVRDRNDQPVAGAVVLFAVRSGRATFRGSRTLTVTTNSAGRAVAEGFLPASAGPMEVSVTATYQGQSAVAVTVAQTNVETAAEVAMQRPTSNATKGGRSLGKVAGWSAAAGAAVAGAIALGSRRGDAVPAIGQVSASHGVALQSSSQVSFAVSLTQGVAARYSWDFGDGTTSSAVNPTHVYQDAGIKTVTVTVSNDAGSVSDTTRVEVKGLSGLWVGTACWRIFLPGTSTQPDCTYVDAVLQVEQTGSSIRGSGDYRFQDGRRFLSCAFSTGSIVQNIFFGDETRVQLGDTTCGASGFLNPTFDRIRLTDGGDGTFLQRQ